MFVLRPILHELLDAEDSRNAAQLEALGVDPVSSPARDHAVEISLDPGAGAPRLLLAAALLDYVVRLDPLVAEVRLEGFDRAMVDELATRLPFEELDSTAAVPASSIAIGRPDSGADLHVDGSGWLASLGESLEEPDPDILLNPVGPLAAATLGAAEVFKGIFAAAYPDAPYSSRFESPSEPFSFFDYTDAGADPKLTAIEIDAHLIGLGGVGAGVLRTLAALGPGLSGELRLVDHDALEIHNLNRVTYGTLAAAEAKEPKVDVAHDYLALHAQNLRVTKNRERFDAYVAGIAPRRADRRYDVILTALDDDEARHAVQRELPRVLIDGATGRDLNIVVERVVIGKWACLGCTRRKPPPVRPAEEGEGCGNLADPRAPTLSFVSALPGILSAGELVKEAMGGGGSLRGAFQHIFMYGPSPDMRRESTPRDDCRIRCTTEPVLHAYELKNRASTRGAGG